MVAKIVTTIAVLLVSLAGVWLYIYQTGWIEFFCHEDSIAENLTAIFYLLSAGAFLYTASRFRFKSLWCWGYALLFFMIAGEEISWGQRILNIKTPEAIVNVNVQNEISLHNLEGVHGTVRAAALIIVLLICFVIPFSEKFWGLISRYSRWGHHPIFPLWATGIITISILLMVVPRVFFHQVIFEIDELAELVLACGFLSFGCDAVFNFQKQSTLSNKFKVFRLRSHLKPMRTNK